MVTISSALESNFARQQKTFLFLALVVIAVFWATGQQVNPLTILIYSLCIGNLVAIPLDLTQHLYSNRKFPYDWFIFMALLFTFMLPAYVLTTLAVVRFAPPAPNMNARDLIIHGWRFPLLVTVVYGVLYFVTRRTRDRLERRNQELLTAVQQSSEQIEMQEQELQRAKEIQRALLPNQIPQLPGYDIAGLWQPARHVGGDYYDVLRLDENRLGICIADVVGKGVSAALLMANVQAAVRAFAINAQSPAWLCGRLNSVLCDNIAQGKFVTFFYGVLDGPSGAFRFCNAGHLSPLLIHNGSVSSLFDGGTVLGLFPGSVYQDSAVNLRPSDNLILFTDGVTEAEDENGLEFGENRIIDVANAAGESSASGLNGKLLAIVSRYCQGRFHDDATLLTVLARRS